MKFKNLPSFIPRSWISSTIIWVMPFNFLSSSNLLNKMPVVQKRRWVSLPCMPSSLTLYPTFHKRSQKKEIETLKSNVLQNKDNYYIGTVIKTHSFTQFLSSFIGNSFRNRNCCNASWLCANDITHSSTN